MKVAVVKGINDISCHMPKAPGAITRTEFLGKSALIDFNETRSSEHCVRLGLSNCQTHTSKYHMRRERGDGDSCTQDL